MNSRPKGGVFPAYPVSQLYILYYIVSQGFLVNDHAKIGIGWGSVVCLGNWGSASPVVKLPVRILRYHIWWGSSPTGGKVQLRAAHVQFEGVGLRRILVCGRSVIRPIQV